MAVVSDQHYWDISGLEAVYLEDSYVLGLHVTPDAVSFELDVVLRRGHPLYEAPKPGDRYCMQRGTLVFRRPREVRLERSDATPATDASGQLDYGNIDGFEIVAERTYYLFGEWGSLQISSELPVLTFSGAGEGR